MDEFLTVLCRYYKQINNGGFFCSLPGDVINVQYSFF